MQDPKSITRAIDACQRARSALIAAEATLKTALDAAPEPKVAPASKSGVPGVTVRFCEPDGGLTTVAIPDIATLHGALGFESETFELAVGWHEVSVLDGDVRTYCRPMHIGRAARYKARRDSRIETRTLVGRQLVALVECLPDGGERTVPT